MAAATANRHSFPRHAAQRAVSRHMSPQRVFPQSTHIMGILNVTEDSFSDGGLYLDLQVAVRHACDMIADGAQIIDIGGESTRPGAVRVPADLEKRRVTAVIRALRSFTGAEADVGAGSADADGGGNAATDADFARHVRSIAISVDTTRASVAEASLDAGADIINDVSGGTLDSGMAPLMAERGCAYVVQHWRGWLSGAQEQATSSYAATPKDSARIVYDELMKQVEAVRAAGVQADRIIIDPGLGFSKPDPELNCALIDAIPLFAASGYPVLIGASRKRFVRRLVEGSGRFDSRANAQASMDDLDAASAMLAAWASVRGAAVVRVHHVRATAAALAAADAMNDAMSDAMNDLSTQRSADD